MTIDFKGQSTFIHKRMKGWLKHMLDFQNTTKITFEYMIDKYKMLSEHLIYTKNGVHFSQVS